MRDPDDRDHGSALTIQCPPKINLYLRIVRRRDDGFHELETVFQSVSGGDTLTAAPADRLSLACSDPEIPTDGSNLVLKAAEALLRRFPSAGGAALELLKRTPAGAGMGGGSVDGAAALALLSRLWGLRPSTDELHAMASELGSDVPFFLIGGTALARGRGEVLEPLPTVPLWLVLVRPPVSVNTGWAYGRWRPESCSGASAEQFRMALASGQPEAVAETLRNDLEPGVAGAVSEIAAARGWLLLQGALGVRMTGSGSVVFGIARDEAHAREIASRSGAPGRAWVARALSAEECRLTPHPA